MINADRAEYGRAAVRVGTPDYGKNGADVEGYYTDATDAIANILHAVYGMELDESAAELALDRALMHFTAEIGGEE